MLIKPSSITASLSGPQMLYQGVALLWHPRIRWLVLIPLCINILLFSSLTWLAGQWLGGLATNSNDASTRLASLADLDCLAAIYCPSSYYLRLWLCAIGQFNRFTILWTVGGKDSFNGV